MPSFYEKIELLYPGAYFILTVRNSSEEWFQSLIRFHSKVFGSGKALPTREMLENSNYIYKGFAYDSIVALFGPNLYDKEAYIQVYEDHIRDACKYFEGNENFLKLNIAETDSYSKLCDFLNVQPLAQSFPHENKS